MECSLYRGRDGLSVGGEVFLGVSERARTGYIPCGLVGMCFFPALLCAMRRVRFGGGCRSLKFSNEFMLQLLKKMPMEEFLQFSTTSSSAAAFIVDWCMNCLDASDEK